MFTGKIILIIGATSAIGAATTAEFAEHGATLALAAKDLKKLEKVVAGCSPKAVPLLLTGDLTNETETKAIVDQTIKHFGKLDVLVNGADVFDQGTVETTGLDQYNGIMNTNVRAVYHVTLLAVPHLIKTKGNIVNVSSVSGIKAFPGMLGYSVSKAAIDQLTRCVALDLAPKKVRVNSVNPEIFMMNLPRRHSLREDKYGSFLAKTKESHAKSISGIPLEVAKSIVFLASDDASFITGVTMVIDGGKHEVSQINKCI